jgi:hypothetical protein
MLRQKLYKFTISTLRGKPISKETIKSNKKQEIVNKIQEMAFKLEKKKAAPFSVSSKSHVLMFLLASPFLIGTTFIGPWIKDISKKKILYLDMMNSASSTVLTVFVIYDLNKDRNVSRQEPDVHR